MESHFELAFLFLGFLWDADSKTQTIIKLKRNWKALLPCSNLLCFLCLLLVGRLWGCTRYDWELPLGVHIGMCIGMCVHIGMCVPVCTCECELVSVVRSWLSRDEGGLTDMLYWHKQASSALICCHLFPRSHTVWWQLHGLIEISQIELVRWAVFECHTWRIFLPDFGYLSAMLNNLVKMLNWGNKYPVTLHRDEGHVL